MKPVQTSSQQCGTPELARGKLGQEQVLLSWTFISMGVAPRRSNNFSRASIVALQAHANKRQEKAVARILPGRYRRL
ncbi:hypothetical protein MPL3356_110477 [Mesorhizobium plurifarium]|uniref:Uncharacterized protein n=1 Tax=Mesorhizobium plurifarium TaxID=69974 RepID=A0A090G6P8_MESPL|nr:hypothetical protein MPL3356_110477 [Mesorhizobium plurifarium]CDX20765.1 hypothetical protein MPLB_1890011 [Mesorhizobium sp. ORS 3324]CDX38208.1 hypothetical protein MPLA_2140040 [Mesorhizobium sp. ORS 3359]CDX58110.1 hypothetical protein MPL3365_290094 [Mesorhizobium plurifarium]